MKTLIFVILSIFIVAGCKTLSATKNEIYALDAGDHKFSVVLPKKISRDFRTMIPITFLNLGDVRFLSNEYNSVVVNGKKYDFGNPPFSIIGTLSMTIVVYKITGKNEGEIHSLDELSSYLVAQASDQEGTFNIVSIQKNKQQLVLYNKEYDSELYQYDSYSFLLDQSHYIQIHFRHIDNATSEKTKKQFRAETAVLMQNIVNSVSISQRSTGPRVVVNLYSLKSF